MLGRVGGDYGRHEGIVRMSIASSHGAHELKLPDGELQRSALRGTAVC